MIATAKKKRAATAQVNSRPKLLRAGRNGDSRGAPELPHATGPKTNRSQKSALNAKTTVASAGVNGDVPIEIVRSDATRRKQKPTFDIKKSKGVLSARGVVASTTVLSEPCAATLRKSKSAAAIASVPDFDGGGAPNNGRSKCFVKTRIGLNGHSGSVGDGFNENDFLRADICRKIREIQRQRVFSLKVRNGVQNQLRAMVASNMGYHSGLEEKERAKHFAAADKFTKELAKGTVPKEQKALADSIGALVLRTLAGIEGFAEFVDECDKRLVSLVKQLPIASFCEGVRGFDHKSLAIIIGEAGNLSDYANPAKLWKRMGCAPFDGKMPSTWRYGKEGKLASDQWEKIGYSPRRRSAMYVIGECLMKQNDGIYREVYDKQKASFALKHPDYKPMRCHLHGMLLASKKLLLNLWIEWNKPSASPAKSRKA